MKASIVMPVYNGEKYIEFAIKSIINQTYKNIQFILVDGSSTDRTMEIVKKYQDHIDTIISEKDNGMYDAINKGFAIANGDLMLWLNSDDFLFPTAIATAVDIMKKHDKVKWLKGRNVYLDSKNHFRKIACFKSYYRSLIQKGYYRGTGLGYIMQETTFWHRDLYEMAGGYIDGNNRLASDFELWCRFAKYETLYSANTLFGAFRQHDDQMSKNEDLYERECSQIRKIRYQWFLKAIKYFVYIYAMLDWKNKIYFNKKSESYFLRLPAYFQ
ncbi:glycosyltransferase [Sulfurimonas sp. HSL-3221]|uniref:glycosyltransferase family 2 protein n=1 Tax=Thiomicrolovo sulfuroxydans TaxID=2894755 RepID=UPI001E282B65|nr:glycosyltransferase family 2 protein [Sulfurimonas sp. HSL-3221]UFS62265.1 glycosyltransferase [Sulfurimonas sp. HSL-3221]